MRNMLIAVLVTAMFALLVASVGSVADSPAEPEPMMCTFEMSFDTSQPDMGWSGTVSGAINGELHLYERWADNYVVGKTEHFFEDNEIITDTGSLKGYDKGVWNFPTYKFRAVGWVTEATGDLADLAGYKMNMMGFTSVFPPIPPNTIVTATGTVMLVPP